MENQVRVFAAAAGTAGPSAGEAQSPEDWRRARAALAFLLRLGMPRMNLLLIGIDGMVWNLLETLLPDFPGPTTTWCPGERLVLPQTGTGTMILHDVGAMALDDQLRLLDWSERAAGRTQIVSMTSEPLLPRLQAGAFIETLYYRLNVVCVDVTANKSLAADT